MTVDITFSSGASVLTQYAERAEQYPVLGRLLWYSISEVVISDDALRQIVQRLQIDERFLPPRIRGVDAFRKATKAAETTYKTNGVKQNFILREVVCEEEEVVRNIVLEEVDSAGRKLNYEPQIGTVTYYRADDVHPKGRVEFRNYAPVANTWLVEVINEIGNKVLTEFDDYANYHHGNAIRSMVTRMLRASSVITVRSSGGVYFSPELYKANIGKVHAFFQALGPGCQFHALPLIDDRDQRQMLVAAFEDEAVKEVERQLDDMATILKDGKKITSERYAQFVDEYKRIRAKASEYSDLLDEQMTRAGESLTVMDQQIVALLNNVKATS